MSIASRIEAIEEHLTDDYDVLTLAGADLTNVDKNIINLKPTWKERLLYFMNNGLEVVWENWDKVSGTGTSITLNNTVEAPMKLEYKGNTSQSGTPTPSSPVDIQVVSGDNSIEVVGKNLLSTNISDYTIGTYARKFISNDNYVLHLVDNNTSVDASGCYIGISSTGEVGGSVLWCLNNGSLTRNYQNNYDGTKPYVCFYPANQETLNKICSRYKVMLAKGEYSSTTLPPYVPYQSASYPISLGSIELNKIGTYQDKIDKSTGKNLIQTTQFSANNYVSQKLTLSIGNYYVSYTGDTASGLYVRKADGTNPTNGTQVAVKYNSTWLSFTISEDGEYYIQFYLSGSGFTNFRNAMLNEGTTALPYEPYGKVWYLKKEIGKVVLDGTENWGEYTTQIGGYRTYTDTVKIGLSGSFQYEFYCDYFDHVAYANVNNIGITMYALYLNIDSSVANTIAGLKTWLSTHKPTVWYPLSTPTYETITDTTLIGQLEAIKKSYESQTNISQVNDGLPFELSVTALGEMA